MNEFDGVITALATPFSGNRVDEASFVRLLHFQLEGGVKKLVIAGTTGEGPTLSRSETNDLFKIARRECGPDAQLIVGTGTNSTAETIARTHEAADWGTDAALLVVPYYNRPPQRGLVAHFSAVAKASKIPVLLYNVPSRTCCSLEVESIGDLSREEMIVGIKEASGDLTLLDGLKSIRREPFWLLSGDDRTGVEFCLRGGHGIVSVVSNLIPRQLVELVGRARAGENDASEEYESYFELLRWLYIESNPIPLKWALEQMGIFRSSELRLPLSALAAGHSEGFGACLRKLNIV